VTTRSSKLPFRLLGTLCRLDRDTDILIAEILSWASIVDFHKNLLVNTHFSKRAKQGNQWEKLLAVVPIPSLYMCKACDEEYPGCVDFEDIRIYCEFDDNRGHYCQVFTTQF
jgi:hypothetical protein